MKYVLTANLTPGMIVGREVVAENGVTLIEKGICLTKAQIESLRNWGVRFLCISDNADIPDDASPDLMLTKASFAKRYFEVVENVRHIFRTAGHFKQLPIIELRKLADHIINPLVNTIGVIDYLYEINAHCHYTFRHSVNVAVVAGIFAKWLSYNEVKCRDLVLAGLLHDIGKLFVPLSILDKPGRLSSIEFDTVKQHALEGYYLLESASALSEGVKMAVLQHHERMDGSGYPFGLPGGKIHRYAKIVAVADIYDAMTSDRAYRCKVTPLSALELIIEQMYDKLDPGVCIPFLNRMRDHFLGHEVLLSDGKPAKIIVLPGKHWTKPLVRTCDGKLLDLKKENIEIKDCLDI